MWPFFGAIFSPSTRLSSLNLFQLKLGDSIRTVTFFADIESGAPYMQIVPPAIDAGPESGSFSFSPNTASASALVTSLQASISPELLAVELEVEALELAAGEAALLEGLLFELQEVKAKTNRLENR